MPVYFEYALKSSLCLAVIFFFYILLLKQITYYAWNRYFLLIFSILSFIVPLININVFVQAQQMDNNLFVKKIPLIADNKIPSDFVSGSVPFNYWQILFAVYIFIGSILLFRLLVQLLSITKIRSKATRTYFGEVEIYHLSESVLPFSFLNNIFLNKDNYTDKELQEIIDHERVHVQQKHTIDVLITELICILNWYSPFAWLIKKAVRENLEFIADDAVMQKGIDRRNYQYLLLKVTGNVPYSIASSLRFASLKSRIRMMNKRKTGKLHLLKFALLVPIITFLLLAFRSKHEKYNNGTKEQNAIARTYILSSLTYSVPDKKVEAVVKKDNGNCLLKTGEALNLEMVFNEKTRLRNLLEKNGYDNIPAHAITFMIDTTLGNNSFSIQVNINLAKDELSKSKEASGTGDNKISARNNDEEKLIQPANSVAQTHSSNVLNAMKVSSKQGTINSEFSAHN